MARQFIPEIINTCFDMWIEFGPTLGTPLSPRIKNKFPELNDEEITELVKQCEAARTFGYNYIYERFTPSDNSNADLQQRFSKDIKLKFSWINDENIHRLFSQGCYYAMK